MKKISQNLKRSLRIVDWCHSSGKYLNYTLLNNLMKDLTHNERNQLVDYIVAKYNVIDAPRLMSYFGTYDQMLLAMHSTTGSEYDLKEHNDRSSDAIYSEMLQYVNKSCSGRCRTVIMLPDNLKRDLLWNLKASTGASSKQIKKFLHLNIC